MFVTFATTAGNPKASKVGNVMSDPDPTTVLIVPAVSPAPAMAKASSTDTGNVYMKHRVKWGETGRGRSGQVDRYRPKNSQIFPQPASAASTRNPGRSVAKKA